MLLRIVGIVFPIFAIVLLGFFYGRRQRPDMAVANALNMSVFMPALIFTALAGKSFDLAANLPIAIGAVAIVVGSGAIGWPIMRLLGYDARTLMPSVMFNNAGNMGLPLLLLTFGEPALGAAVVLMLVVTMLQFALSPWLLEGRLSVSTFWREPFIVAALVGVAVSLGGVTIWPPLMAAGKLLGDIALGLMIFSLGVRLATARFNAWGIGLAGAILTPVTGLLIAWAVVSLHDFSRINADILFIFGALPPAVSNFIFAERYRQEPDKVASIVMIGNAAAVVFIPLALALRL